MGGVGERTKRKMRQKRCRRENRERKEREGREERDERTRERERERKRTVYKCCHIFGPKKSPDMICAAFRTKLHG